MYDHEEETINEENAHPKVIPHNTTVTNISAKFPYLKKGEYDIWAMKMKNFISSSDLLFWYIILKGNSAKSMTTDNDGNLKIRPPVTAKEHQQVQKEEKARTILLSALPDEHMGDFYHMINARDILNAIKARFEEGLDKGYDKMQKILTQMNTLKIKPNLEDVNMKFLRGLPPSWSGIALILKTKGGLKYISFDDLYIKLKFLEIDTKGYSLSSSTLSNVAFVSTGGSSQGNLSYQESRNDGYTTSPGSSSSKGSLKSKCSVVDDVIYSFFANHEIDQHLVYEDLDQMNKEDFEEYDLKHQMAMLSIKVHRFEKKHGRKIKFNGGENARQNSNNYQKYKSKEVGKDRTDSKAMVVVDGSIDWDKQTEEGNTKPRSLENFSMVAGIEIASDADSEGEVVSANNVIPVGVSVSAGTVAAAVFSPQPETEFALMGLSIEAKWNNNSRNLYKLIDSSMSVRTKRELGLDKYIKEGELGIDDSKVSIFHTNSDDLEGQPIYDRSSEQSTNDLQTCDSSVECLRPNHSDHDFTDSISSVSAPARNCILGRRPTGKPVNLNRPKPVSAGQQPNPVSAGHQNPVSADQPIPVSAGQPNPVSAGQPNPVSAGDGILGPRPLNIQPMRNKDKLEDFEDFDGGEVTFGGSTEKISGKGTIKTKTLNFENMLYVEELEEEMGIDDFVFSIFHTNSDDLEGQPIYNRFASVEHMKAVPLPLTGNYMPPSNIPDIDESQMIQECSRPNHSDHASNDLISNVSAP
nr:hypothetical protein [Tanacetum cinerariifolium]